MTENHTELCVLCKSHLNSNTVLLLNLNKANIPVISVLSQLVNGLFFSSSLTFVKVLKEGRVFEGTQEYHFNITVMFIFQKFLDVSMFLKKLGGFVKGKPVVEKRFIRDE